MQPGRHDTRGFTSEIKFVVPAALGVHIREWARARLAPDPHGSGEWADEYAVTSLYLDTEDRDVFHRRGSYGRSKYRVRRYQVAPTIFLERKLRTSGRLSKRRSTIDIAMLERLATDPSHVDPALAWFHGRIALRRLRPVCQISYMRMARGIDTHEGEARLTLDEAITALPNEHFHFADLPGTPLLQDQVIVELKCRGGTPALFRQLVETFALEPQRSSKYRVAAEALGLVGTHA